MEPLLITGTDNSAVNNRSEKEEANGWKIPRTASWARVEQEDCLLQDNKMSVVRNLEADQPRGKWSNPVEFVLSMLGFCIGLGNVWRFPFLCYRNGGGAFLIPYLIMLFGVGLPLVILELTLGQYSSQGPITVWKCCPIAKGLGMGMVLCDFIACIYYNMITGWALYYLYLSLRAVLPWQCCDSSWAKGTCVSFAASSCDTYFNTSSEILAGNVSKSSFAADQFFHNAVLEISDSIYNVGGLNWKLIIPLFVAWFLVSMVLIKGIKSLGKIAYFTSTFPFLLLMVLFCRAIIEPGATDGLSYFFTPRWEILQSARVWSDAAAQIFFSTAVCCGGMVTMASYNRFHDNIIRDSLIIVIGNGATSLFSGTVVFSILGFMAYSQNTTVDKVVTEGPGLTFVVYPQAVTLLPLSPLWSVLFFVMLAMLALSSMFPSTETIITAVKDQFPRLRKFEAFVTLGVCGTLFLLGFMITTNGGMYILTLLDTYAVGYSLMVLGICEIVVVSYRYGASKLRRNLEEMLGATFHPAVQNVISTALQVCWVGVTPLLLCFAILFTILFMKPIKYGSYEFPTWVNQLGFFLTFVSILPIPIYAIFKIAKFRLGPDGKITSFWKSLVHLSSPSEDWKPSAESMDD